MANATFTLGKLLGTVVTAADTATTALNVVSAAINAVGDGAAMLNLYSREALLDMQKDMAFAAVAKDETRETRAKQSHVEMLISVDAFKAKSPEHAATYDALHDKYAAITARLNGVHTQPKLVAAE